MFQIKEVEKMPAIVRNIENKLCAVKLKVKRPNIEEKSFTYEASGIFEISKYEPKTQMDNENMTDSMEDSATQVTLHTMYHSTYKCNKLH